MRIIAALATLTLTLPGVATAQVCIGNPSLAETAANLGGHIGFFDGGRQYGGGAVIGSPLFVGGDYTYVDLDDTSVSVKALSAQIGVAFTGDDAPVTACIGAEGSYEWGLETLGVDFTSRTAGPFVGLGATTPISEIVSLLPYARFGWFYEWVTADAGAFGESTDRDDFGTVMVGLNLLVDEMLTVGPFAAMPLGVDDDDPTYGAMLSFGVGGPS